MPRNPWKYYESGATGWTELTPASEWPNPVSTPITSPLVSTQKKFPLATGANSYLTPETTTVDEPVTFAWLFQSGAIFVDRLKTICRDNNFFRAQGHMPDREWTGKIIKIEEKLLPRAQTDYRDLTVTLEQQNPDD